MPTVPKKKATKEQESVKKQILASLRNNTLVPKAKRKRKLKEAPLPAIYTLGPCGQAWQETQLHNRAAKLRTIGASEAQVTILAPRHFYQLSKWARAGLKVLFQRERLAKKGGAA